MAYVTWQTFRFYKKMPLIRHRICTLLLDHELLIPMCAHRCSLWDKYETFGSPYLQERRRGSDSTRYPLRYKKKVPSWTQSEIPLILQQPVQENALACVSFPERSFKYAHSLLDGRLHYIWSI